LCFDCRRRNWRERAAWRGLIGGGTARQRQSRKQNQSGGETADARKTNAPVHNDSIAKNGFFAKAMR
jgi:hypothetical protein